MNSAKCFDADNACANDLIRVLIVEDHEMLRIGLKYTLQYMRDIEVVGMAEDGPSAVAKAEELRPNVILMDIGLPGFDGIEATRRIKEKLNSHILMLTSRTENSLIIKALEAGAGGYCSKEAPSAKLHTAINSVASGATWLDEEVSQCLIRTAQRSNPDITSESLALCESELRVLGLLLEGASSDEIGEEVGLSNSDLQMYLKKLIQKVSWSGTTVNRSARKVTQSTDFIFSKVCPTCKMRLEEENTHCPYDKSELQDDPLIASIFADRYEILSVLGEGTSGVVYKARHRYMQKNVAIKVMHMEHIADIGMLKRFRQEAAAASSLTHPNIVNVIDFGLSSDGQSFMIMDYLKGKSLDQIIEEHEGIPWNQAVELFKQICSGVGYAHDNGIIHRDLKPNNVLVVDCDGPTPQIKLVDFGTAKLVVPDAAGAGLTAPGQIFGSPTYMSPEQCMGLELEASSDIYSMGTLMYEALVGSPPFRTESVVEAMYKQVNEECPSIAIVARKIGKAIDNRLQAIVMKCLRKNKYHRYQSMQELSDDLSGLVPFSNL